MKCHACGQDNADSALFCTACRRPLVAPAKLPTRLEPLAQPALAAVPAGAGYAGGATFEAPRNRFAPPNADAATHAGDASGPITQEEGWAAIVGEANAAYYLERFEGLARGERGGWHWPGFLVTWYWMLYRKMWGAAVAYFLAPYAAVLVLGGVAAAAPAAAGVLYIAWIVGQFVLPGLLANRWYFRHCERKIRDVRARGGSREQMLARMEAAGSTSNLFLIVGAVLGITAILGILAAVALPAYQTYTVKAKIADAMMEGRDVTQAVGRQYEQTGQLPTDIDRLAAGAAHQSKYLRGVSLDGSSGIVTLRVQPTSGIDGSIQFVPSSDNNRHLSWSCTTEDLVRYVPAACRPQGGR